MAVGRVIRYDGARGYGFISPDEGGEDVFLHANDMVIPEAYIRTGTLVEFEVVEGERGPKASSVRLAGTAVGATMVSSGATAGLPRQSAHDDELCDVLRPEEFTTDVTELLLAAVPTLTGAQIVQVRGELLQFAKKRGWVEG
ncbi:cold shock domain-containing protein [Streptomyces sp. NPDC047022]|uniref:cold-shock protein n=1 Tax=Streptomyces sp. NPDC047022 TaxID=3155737 RepID=UPI0033FAB24D